MFSYSLHMHVTRLAWFQLAAQTGQNVNGTSVIEII